MTALIALLGILLGFGSYATDSRATPGSAQVRINEVWAGVVWTRERPGRRWDLACEAGIFVDWSDEWAEGSIDVLGIRIVPEGRYCVSEKYL